MASDDFPQFLRLPKEIQHMIWKIAVVEENKGRIICLHKRTRRVIATKSRLLAPSPVFSASQESRVIAKMVYSTPLTIFKTRFKALERCGTLFKSDVAGVIRINWDHDIFMLGLGFRELRGFSDIWEFNKHASAKLVDRDLKKIQNVIEYHDYPSQEDAKFDKARFTGVNTYYYIQGTGANQKAHVALSCVTGHFDKLQDSQASRHRLSHLHFTDRIVGPLCIDKKARA